MAELTYNPLTKRAVTTLGEIDGKADAAIVIGGATPEKFIPNINASKWEDKCFLNMNFKNITVNNQIPSFESGNVEITVGPLTVFFYTLNDGVLETGVRLSRAVPSLIALELPLVYSDGLSFYPQGTLTQEELAEGHDRPDNVVGSIAVYWKERNNEYKTGKFCHLYRWECTDADGAKAWCDHLRIESNELIIGLPVAWLASAKYPVTIMGAGDTIGYESNGASGWGPVTIGCKFTAASDGTLDGTGQVYVLIDEAAGASANLQIAVYGDNGGSPSRPGSKIDESAALTVTFTSGYQVKWSGDVSGLSGSISAGPVWVCVSDDNTHSLKYRYDAGDANQSVQDYDILYGAWPATGAFDLNTAYLISIYVDYTPAAGGPYTYDTAAGSLTTAGAAPTRRLDMWRTKTGEL